MVTKSRDPIEKLEERQRAVDAVEWLRTFADGKRMVDVLKALKLELYRPLVAFWLHKKNSKRIVPRKIKYIKAIERLRAQQERMK